MTAQREGASVEVRINEAALAALVEAAGAAARTAGLAPPTIDGLLAIRGIIEIVEAGDDEAVLVGACAAALTTFDEAIDALVAPHCDPFCKRSWRRSRR
jgi:uncharacterized protein YicC (UPF0701 family)